MRRMTTPGRRKTSLSEQQREFVFHRSPNFAKVRRNQVRAADILLAEIDKKIIYPIRNFSALNATGIGIGGGAILWGDKGTGKTFLSGFIATEIEDCARFLDMRLFPREDMNASPTSEDVRCLCALAREYIAIHNKPVILFYDEVETAGEATLQQLRLELCGINGRPRGLFCLLTSTIDPTLLDPMLFRDGRIGIHIECHRLTTRGLLELLVYAFERESMQSDVDLEGFAQLLEEAKDMDTPAAIMQFRDNVKLAAALEQKTTTPRIGNKHLLAETLERITGQSTEEELGPESQRILAIHEAGHVVFGYHLGIIILIASIAPQLRKQSAHNYRSGYIAWRSPENQSLSGQFLKNLLVMGLGGKVADTLFGHRDIITQEDDFAENSRIAHILVAHLGYGQILQQRFGSIALYRPMAEYSEDMKMMLEQDIGLLLKEAAERAQKLIYEVGEEHIKNQITGVAEALFKEKTLFRAQLMQLLEA